jgi:repressor LexA
MARTYDPKKYNALLLYLQEFFAAHDWAPTFDEILAGAGLSSKCLIRPYLDRLRADGMVQFEPDKRRTLRLTDKGRSYPNRPRQRVAAYVSKAARINAASVERMLQLPVVGRTFAGQTTPIPTADFLNVDEFTTIEVSEDVLPPRARRDQYFVLEVRGDSMIEAGIYDGDYVICRKSQTANNNEMVVALLTDANETTLKYFFRENDHIRLQPANSTMGPILIHDSAHLEVQGVVVQVVHCREEAV